MTKTISDYQAMGILNQLLIKKLVTQKEVDEVADLILDKEMEDAVRLFHLLFCGQEHHKEACLFEQEELKPDTWIAPIHIEWVEYTKKIIKELRLNAQSFRETLGRMRTKLGELEEMKEEDGNWMKLIELYIQTRLSIVRLPMLDGISPEWDLVK